MTSRPDYHAEFEIDGITYTCVAHYAYQVQFAKKHKFLETFQTYADVQRFFSEYGLELPVQKRSLLRRSSKWEETCDDVVLTAIRKTVESSDAYLQKLCRKTPLGWGNVSETDKVSEANWAEVFEANRRWCRGGGNMFAQLQEIVRTEQLSIPDHPRLYKKICASSPACVDDLGDTI